MPRVAASMFGSTARRSVRQSSTLLGFVSVMSTAPLGSERTSPAVGPRYTDASATTSATECPVAPQVEKSIHRGAPSRPTAPMVGFHPTSPHIDAGMRTEPPPSDDVAIGTRPAASAAADPPLEPPGERSRFHGFRVAPNTGLNVAAVHP